jgi:hypothetical protein
MMEALHHEKLPVDGVMRVIEQGAGHRHRVLRTGIYAGMYFASILCIHSHSAAVLSPVGLVWPVSHTRYP